MPQNTQQNGLDPTVLNLTKAIRDQETGGGQFGSAGNYTIAGKSGEFGAYQFEPDTWNNLAPKFGVNTPLVSATPQEQNAVAYNYVMSLKNQGYNPMQIASIWNSGKPDPAATGTGTNASGANYNVPQYANNVYNLYNQYKGTGMVGGDNQGTGLPTYGATFAASPADNPLVFGLKALGNVPSSVYGIGAGLLNIGLHPIQTAENLGGAAIGGVENLTGQNAGGAPDQNQQKANAFGQALVQRYGSLAALKNTAENDPAGFALDLATLAAGGEGVVAKGADLADLAAGTGRASEAAAGLGEAGAAAKYGVYGTAARQSIEALNTRTMSTLGKIASPITGLPSAIIRATLTGGADEEALAAAARTGIELPAAAVTANPLVQAGEALAATGAGEAAYSRRVDAAVESMRTLADKIVESTGGETDPTLVGKSIVEGMQSLEASHEKAISALYNTLEDRAGDVAARTSATTRMLEEAIANQQTLGETANLNYFKNKLSVVQGSKTDEARIVPLDEAGKTQKVPKSTQYPPPTFSTLKDLRTLVGRKVKNFNDPITASNKADLIHMYGALSEDMRATLLAQRGGQNLAALWDKANVEFGDSMDRIASTYAKTIRKLADNGQESLILSKLIKPSMAIEDIPKIMEMAGEEGAANIRAAFTKNLLDSAKDASTGNFTAGKIDKALAKYGEKINAILPPEQIQQLKDLGKLSDAMGTVFKLQKGASSSTFARMALQLKAFGEPAGLAFGAYKLLTGDIAGAAATIGTVVGAEGLSRFFGSELGNRALQWGAKYGTDFAKTAVREGLTPPPPEGTMPPHDSISGNPISSGGNQSALEAGGLVGAAGGAPRGNLAANAAGQGGATTGVGVAATPAGNAAREVGAGAGAGVPANATRSLPAVGGEIKAGQAEGGITQTLSASQKKSPEIPLTSDLKPATLGGRIKQALQNYLDNTQVGLSTKDVNEGGQKFNVGLTSVKGRIPSATDDLATEADTLYKKGDFEAAQKKYNEALAAGTNTLSTAFEGTGIKLKPRGVGFGVYGDSLEPNYDAIAIVPKGKEDLFHYILSDVADRNFHQFSMLTYRQTAADAPFGIVDEARGVSNEPFVSIALTKTLSAADVGELQAAAREAGLGGLSLREGGKSIDIINLSKYNDNYEQFTKGALDFQEKLAQRGILGEVQRGSAEARFVGSDPNEGHGLTSYQSLRDSFRTQNPGYFNTDENFTSRVLERLKNKQSVSRTELEQMAKQQDITPTEREAVLNAMSDIKGSDMKKVNVADLAIKIKGKSLPIEMYETDQYASYGINEAGLDYMPSKGESPKTLVFKTPVEHGNRGHFGDTSHFGHTRVLITEEDGQKIGYINEIQSDVFQKESNLVQSLAGEKLDAIRAKINEPFNAQRDALDARFAQSELTHNVYQEMRYSIMEANRKALAEGEQQQAANLLTPEQNQLLFQGKNNRYQDTLLRGTLQYFDKQGVDTVRMATPSSIAKIEGYINEDNLAPYEVNGGERANSTMSDLEHGDTIQYGGEDYTVVGSNAYSNNFSAAPSDSVRTFRFSHFVDEEAQSRWDDLRYEIERDAETLKLDWETPEGAAKMLTNPEVDGKRVGIDDDVEKALRAVVDGENPEDVMKEEFARHIDFSSVQDIYGEDQVYSNEIHNGSDTQVYVVEHGSNAETFGQPSTYESGLDASQAQLIDPHPDNSTTPKQADTRITEEFQPQYATVLKGYVEMYDRFLRKLAKEENIPIKYVDKNDSTWYEMPLTKVKRYLFG